MNIDPVSYNSATFELVQAIRVVTQCKVKWCNLLVKLYHGPILLWLNDPTFSL